MSCLRAGLARCARPIAPLSTRFSSSGVTFRRQQSTLSQLLSDYRTLQAPYTPQEENRAEWESRRKALRKKLGLYRLLEDVELESLVRALRAGQESQQDAVDAGDDFDLTPGSGSWNVTRIKGTQSNLAANLEAARVSSGRPKPRFEAEAHALLKQYHFKDWPTGMDFLNQATEVIEDQDHHPSVHMKLDPAECKLLLSVMTHTHTPRRPASFASKARPPSDAGEPRHVPADKEMPDPAPGITKKDILLAWELDRLAENVA